MNKLTFNEDRKVTEIKNRLARISSPVLRLQAILQFSQIVDILTLGDTAREQLLEDKNHIEELENKVAELKGENTPLHEDTNANPDP